MGKYTNLMSSELDVEKVNTALENAGSSEETVAELNRLVGATPLKEGYTITSELAEHEKKLAGGGYSTELLLDNSTTEQLTGDLSLSASVLDYDAILVTHCYSFSTHKNLPAENMVSKVVYENLVGQTSGTVGIMLVGQKNLWLQFKDETTVTIASGSNESNLLKIYGIKY